MGQPIDRLRVPVPTADSIWIRGLNIQNYTRASKAVRRVQAGRSRGPVFAREGVATPSPAANDNRISPPHETIARDTVHLCSTSRYKSRNFSIAISAGLRAERVVRLLWAPCD
ncbi:hypothetical protein EVAR_58745_1 [Eumeta japonica]|uniref:Uncharacterized protein n=1 Tax=Eumeta variegata TaxID=151549 RepID=A0A4C1YS39_EUMVA|nr:hypothetical protein EVAR_58745_1 [Eumeta japonica]